MNKITFPLTLQMKRPEVANLHEALVFLGSTIADTEKTNQRYGASTRAAVTKFQTAHNLPVTGTVDEATARAINKELSNKGALDLPPGGIDPPVPPPPTELQLFSVQGEVVKPDGSALPNLVVRAYDRALCEWRHLGGPGIVVRTNDFGRYTFNYDPAQLKVWGKTRADLKVEVRDAATGDVVLSESPLILGARPKETVNFSIGEQRYRGPNEFARVQSALAPLLQSHDEDLRCIEVADVLILAREAKLAASNVAYYVKARRWSATYNTPAPLFYGLMRRGEPARIDALLARPLARLWNKLEEAKARNIIALPLNNATRQQLAQLQQSYLSRPEHPHAQLLGTTSLTAEQSATFTLKLTGTELSGDAFWQALEAKDGFSPETIIELQRTFELQAFTGDNTSLTLRLRGDLGGGAPQEVAAFSVQHWRDTVLADGKVEIPDEVLPQGSATERRAAYAELLYRGAESRYPTASLAGQMKRDPAWVGHATLDFFSANPEFEFRDQRVLTYMREHSQTLPAAERDDLLRIEQLFHLVPEQDKLAHIAPMWSAGLRSAPQVAYLGRANLKRRVGASLNADSIKQIYRKALHITSLALNVYLRFNPNLNRLSLAALRMSQPPAREALARATIALPEWEELFGSADACECSHCESALSPAAYLVDSMAFLERAVDGNGNNALDELLARRPDLGTLRLTCENTETPLPHIDLVNEILEAIVASADGRTLPGTAIGETTWESDHLAAQPEHVEPAAYDVVRASMYPFDTLPFDLWADEGRRYLKQMGIARAELMRALPAKPGVTQLHIATEALGMSSLERNLIAQPKPTLADLAPRWGYDKPTALTAARLGSVQPLLQRARIDYDGLLRLLNTRYINPDRLISVQFGAVACSLDGAVLVGQDGTALAGTALWTFLDRLHRFLRLQRRLDSSEYEVDSLVEALGVNDFDAPLFFQKLADAQTLRSDLRLTLTELCSWWAPLDTYLFEPELPSQYEAIYLNEALFPDLHAGTGPYLRNDVFALRADRQDIAITTSTDASLSPWLAQSDGAVVPLYTLQPDYVAYIQSATQLTTDDLLLLTQVWLPKDNTTGHVALNLANLSLLYRVGSFTRALGISVKALVRVVGLTGNVPLRMATATSGPVQTRNFYETWREIDSGEFSVEALAYLSLHEAEAVSVLAPSATSIDAWLASTTASFTGIVSLTEDAITAELKSAVAQSLGSTLAVDPAVLEALLFTHRIALGKELLTHIIVAANPSTSGLPVPQGDFASLFTRLHKFALAWNGLKLDITFLPFVLDQGPGLGWSDIAAFPITAQSNAQFGPWRRLVAASDLQQSTFTLEQSLFALLDQAAAQTNDPTSFVLADFLVQISNWAGWPLADVTYLTGANGFNLALPSAMRDEQALMELKEVFDLIRSKGVAAEQAHAWTIAELSYAEAQAVKQSLSLAYSQDRWLEALGAIQDELRTIKRDALLAQLLNKLHMEDSDAFYQHYLIDPAEAPCGTTSRIVEAHAAVQLFAQRILLNLEPFAFERADAEAWQWRKKYRVWEAARKIFLWPENWLEPEWRDNKSAFFAELEDELLQGEVTAERAEELYLNYLHKVDSVAQLEIMGMYYDENDADGNDTLHVFARTKGVSQRYYYRRLENGWQWTPWEPVELDISGDHLIPVVGNARLYLFWPEFSQSDNPNSTIVSTTEVESDPERADEIRTEIVDHEQRIDEIDAALTINSPNFKGDASSLEAEKESHEAAIASLEAELDALTVEKTSTTMGDKYAMEISMKWSEFQNGRWTSEKVSKDKITYTTSDKLSRHYFTGWVEQDGVLRISARINKVGNGEGIDTPHAPEGYLGYFYFDSYSGNLAVSEVEVADPVGDVKLTGALPNSHSAEWFDTWWSSDSLELEIGAAAQKRLLIKSPGNLYYAHQYGQYGQELSPFFFADGERTYLVQPIQGYTAGSVAMNAKLGTPRMALAQIGQPESSVASRAIFTAEPILQHYDNTAANTILDHSVAANSSLYSMSSTVGSLIEADTNPSILAGTSTLLNPLKYTFTRFYHPHTGRFLQQAYRYGVDGLLSPDPAWDDESAQLYRQLLPSNTFDFEDLYSPNIAWVSNNFSSEQLDEQIDFDHDGAYGSYNWELFFHAPLLIATRLMQNQRYADARRWLHHIFDPTSTDGVGPERFWKIKPFFQEQQTNPQDALQLLLNGSQNVLEQQIEAWEADPLNPHLLARMRTSAYMQATVIRYLDCLLGEADLLFQRDTREDINEARQLYVLAGEILGDQPTLLPPQEPSTLTPNLLLGRFKLDWNGLPGFNPLDPLSSILPVNLPGAPASRPGTRVANAPLIVDASLSSSNATLNTVSAQGGATSLDTLLLFCVPHNEALYAYWSIVADRLFKVRNCMNLSGQVRQLALYAPPIDPAALVRASAAGLSIEAMLSGLFTPRSHYRFNFLLQKALEFCSEARNLGAAMLAALEKKDGEALSVLRSSQETALLESIRTIKQSNINEADAALASLQKSRESAAFRADYYALLERISTGEQKSLNKQDASRGWQIAAESTEILASALHIIPYTYTGTTGVQVAFGGPQLGAAAQAVAGSLRARASALVHQSSQAGITAGYDRRFKDWKLQADLARKEIEQLDKQILAAEIRKQIAEAELTNHDKQTTQASEVGDFLRLKFSNDQLYSWMISKLSSTYFQAYQMAEQLAMQVQVAFQQELGPDEQNLTFIQPANWDSLKKGLQAGELLNQQLRQMETAHLTANKRELEITKHVSLSQLDPLALLKLRETGACEIHLPEVLFDMDFPGQFFRRIKAVRVSVPCVVGPYTNVSATLHLLSSWTRRTTDLVDTTQPIQDAVGAPQTAIAVSSANQDGGMFELSFGDPRYLPFEGAGVVSSWQLELPTAVRAFDYDTIADVVFHVSYTAREATDPNFKIGVNATFESNINTWGAGPLGNGASLMRMLSLRHEFSSEWNRLMHPSAGQAPEIVLQLSKQHFPKCMDYLWEDINVDGLAETPKPIAIQIDAVNVYLNPSGLLPSDVDNVTLNGRAPTLDAQTGLTAFDSVAVVGTITNTIGVEVPIVVDRGELRAEEWRDIYIVLKYQIVV